MPPNRAKTDLEAGRVPWNGRKTDLKADRVPLIDFKVSWRQVECLRGIKKPISRQVECLGRCVRLDLQAARVRRDGDEKDFAAVEVPLKDLEVVGGQSECLSACLDVLPT